MRKINTLLWCLTLWAGVTLSYQSLAQDANYERDYKRAVALYKTGEYNLAMADLLPLTARKYQHGLVPFAQYYYSLAALKNNRPLESQQMLLQLRERFPEWKKMDEVSYLLADLSFRDKQYNKALEYLAEITNVSVKKDVEPLKRVYINPVQDLALLKKLNQQHPSDKIVALRLIDVIQRTSNDKADLELSDDLTNRFGIAPSKPANDVTPMKKNTNSQSKGYYNIAVILPFKVKEFSPNQRVRSNQFAYDMYEGMKLAKAKLQQEGILVNMFTYDIGSDPEDMLNVVNNTNFAQTDLIVGPVYSEPAKLAADFAQSNGIFYVHPTSLVTDLSATFSSTLLLHPSFERQASQSFDYMRSLPAATSKKVAIYYGSSRRDSTLAAAYRAKATASGYQVADFRRTREKLDTTATISSVNKPGHIAVFSSNENDGNKILALMDKRHINVPLLANSTAFNVGGIGANAFNNHPVYIIDTEFIDIAKSQVRDFQNLYFSKRNTVPSIYALQGYDLVLFFGRMLHKYQNQLRNGLDVRSYDDDYLLSGFNYQHSNDNQVVPIIQIDDARWVRVNAQ
ncbi:ABC transporter substrate-binding protein [Runella sp. SP2]|uniref:ABC transporter substrate-binding protein n=1 Tax=Runella sp. SP2 TaxID=2268026 RepID=UPI000F07BD07|nr:ABC transporter substrate-binding protein [Runella sp. SP2]AYQ33365.1 amino acid ABC transporter substrate-binding protein [Runella sp. SP2]